MLIYYKNTEIYSYVYYINNLTSKYITIQAKNKNITKEYIIEKYSFVNRICNYLEYDYDEENINIKLERYLKVNGKTHITKYNSFKSIIKEDINLEDFGFNFGEIMFTYNKDKLSLKLENNITKLDENFNVKFLTKDLRKKLGEKYTYDELLNKQQELLNKKIEEIKKQQEINIQHNSKMEDIAYCFKTTAIAINKCKEEILEVLYAKLIDSKFGLTYLIYT